MRNEHDASDTATNIRVGLARKRATQGDLAELLNLSQPAIHRRMSGQVPWRVQELSQVAKFLGLDLADLAAAEASA